jgi:hypothetical protein
MVVAITGFTKIVFRWLKLKAKDGDLIHEDQPLGRGTDSDSTALGTIVKILLPVGSAFEPKPQKPF